MPTRVAAPRSPAARPLAAALTLAGLLTAAPLRAAEPTSRIVSVGGAVTEIVFALGAGPSVVGVDTTSTYPEAVRGLPTVGYQRHLSAEGILSLGPTLVLAVGEAGPPAALAQIRSAGVRTEVLPVDPSVAGVLAKVRAVARLLGREREGETLAAAIERDVDRATALVSRARSRPRVLFLLGGAQGATQAAGSRTAAEAMIRLAGGTNAVAGYQGYRPLTPEAAVAASPEVILVTTSGLEAAGGLDRLLALPGLGLTPAGRTRRVAAMEALLLLGFGPRIGQALVELAGLIHPELVAGTR